MSCIALICLQALVVIAGPGLAAAQTPSPRIALVVGNGSYTARPIPTAPNDAGLVAQTLTAAGFDVTGARDLDGDALHRTVRDFIDHAARLGRDGIAYVYFAGLGVQYGGENYFLPIDASLARETDVPLQAFRLSDLTRALASLPIQARVVVLDGAYRNDFPAREKLAGGLALVEPEAGTVLALNAAPDTVGPDTTGAYGVYAQAVSETMREPGVPVAAVFDRIRLKVNQDTQGADVPWSESKLTTAFTFLEPVAGAPAPQATAIPAAELQKRPLRDFTPADAYNAAIARDDFTGYRDYLETFPKSPYARRVRVLLAARREALTWRRTVAYATPDAYWSYLRRYPRGLHASEARDRLASLAAPLLPPPDFAPVEYDVPPPPEPEIVIVDRPVVVFAEPDEAPPPPPPLFLLPPPVEVVDVLPPPEPAVGPVFLPIPVPIPIPFGRSAYGPGELRPPRGIPGGYARPQPFISTPAGGLQPRPPRNDQAAPPPNAQRLPPASGQASPALPPSVASPSPTPGVAPVISNAPRPVPNSVAPGSGVQALRPLPGQGGVAARPQAEDPPRLPLPSGASPLRPGSSPAVSLPGGTAKGSPSTTTGARPAPLAAPVLSGTPPPAPVAGPQKALPAVPAIAARPRLNPKAAPSLPAPAVAGPAKVPATVQSPAQPLDQRKALQDQVRQQQEKANQNQLQQQRQQQEQARQQQMQQQRQVQERSRQQQLQEQRRQQDQTHQQQLLQQRQQQEQVRQQQLQRQRQQQEQARQQQLGQQRQQQEQARQQQLQQQRQQQEQARQQQVQQQRQQQDQARQQQLQQQRQQQEQARQQQIQLQHAQQEQARQQQLQQQRVQQEQARQQQIQQQRQQQLQQHSQPRQDCGKPGQPACH